MAFLLYYLIVSLHCSIYYFEIVEGGTESRVSSSFLSENRNVDELSDTDHETDDDSGFGDPFPDDNIDTNRRMKPKNRNVNKLPDTVQNLSPELKNEKNIPEQNVVTSSISPYTNNVASFLQRNNNSEKIATTMKPFDYCKNRFMYGYPSILHNSDDDSELDVPFQDDNNIDTDGAMTPENRNVDGLSETDRDTDDDSVFPDSFQDDYIDTDGAMTIKDRIVDELSNPVENLSSELKKEKNISEQNVVTNSISPYTNTTMKPFDYCNKNRLMLEYPPILHNADELGSSDGEEYRNLNGSPELTTHESSTSEIAINGNRNNVLEDYLVTKAPFIIENHNAPFPCPASLKYDKKKKRCITTCPSGFKFDEDTKECMKQKKSCPSGFKFDEDTKECMKQKKSFWHSVIKLPTAIKQYAKNLFNRK